MQSVTANLLTATIQAQFDQKASPTFCWLPDNEYTCPTLQEVEALLAHTKIEDFKYSGEFPDCDDFADFLRAYVKQQRYRSGDRGITWAFFEAHGRFGGDGPHALNGVLTADRGVVKIEPQTDELVIGGFAPSDVCWMVRV